MFRNYLAAAIGNLGRNWLYAGVTVLGLAISFTAAILIGLYVRDEFSYDRWLPDHRDVYLVSQTLSPPGGAGGEMDADPTRSDVAGLLKLDFPQVEETTRLVAAQPIVRRGNVEAVEPRVFWADPNLFKVLRLPVVAGDLTAALQKPDSIVLTQALARKYFGRDDPIGETLTLNPAAGGVPGGDLASLNSPHPMHVTAVIADLPSETHLRADAFASGQASFSRLAWLDRGPAWPFGQAAYTYVKLRPGASGAALARALPGFVARHVAAAPLMGSRFALRLSPIADLHLDGRRDVMGAMTPRGDRAVLEAIAATGGLILAVAMINFITLVTARGARRAREVAVRKVVGARRRDLVIQFMGEAIFVVVLAMVLAVALAELGLPFVNAYLQRTMTFDYGRDPTVLACLVGVTITVGLVAGAYPALTLSAFRPVAALKGGPAQVSGSPAVRQALILVQFAVLIGLILCAATLFRQTRFALQGDLRLNKDQVLWVSVPRPCGRVLSDAFRAVPGVRDAVCSSEVPLTNGSVPVVAIGIKGRQVRVNLSPVDFGFLEFYGLTPLAGRFLDRAHGADARLLQPGAEGNPSVVLNESAVRLLGYSAPQSAVSQSFAWSRIHSPPGGANNSMLAPQSSEVVGVVRDFSMGSARSPVEPLIFYVDPDLWASLNVRLSGHDIPQTLQALDRMWRSRGNVRPMQRLFVDQATRELYKDVITQGVAIGICAGLAIFIACIGLFALAAFTTERRTKEIGVRKAMGASTFDVVKLLLWQFTQPVLWANLIAWPAAWWAMDHWLRGFAYHVDLPLWLFAAATVGAVIIAWATVATHAWLVARAKPVTALRYE